MVIPIHAILRAATGVTIRSVTGSQRFCFVVTGSQRFLQTVTDKILRYYRLKGNDLTLPIVRSDPGHPKIRK